MQFGRYLLNWVPDAAWWERGDRLNAVVVAEHCAASSLLSPLVGDDNLCSMGGEGQSKLAVEHVTAGGCGEPLLSLSGLRVLHLWLMMQLSPSFVGVLGELLG